MSYIEVAFNEEVNCYDSKTLGLVKEKNLVLGNTRKLNRELCTRLSILYTNI